MQVNPCTAGNPHARKGPFSQPASQLRKILEEGVTCTKPWQLLKDVPNSATTCCMQGDTHGSTCAGLKPATPRSAGATNPHAQGLTTRQPWVKPIGQVAPASRQAHTKPTQIQPLSPPSYTPHPNPPRGAVRLACRPQWSPTRCSPALSNPACGSQAAHMVPRCQDRHTATVPVPVTGTSRPMAVAVSSGPQASLTNTCLVSQIRPACITDKAGQPPHTVCRCATT